MKLIGYLSNGYPTLEESRKRAKHYVANGVDVIEADFPTQDPYLDSDFLKQRIFGALENTTDYELYMDNILKIKEENPGVDFLINIYEITVKDIGYDRFAQFMKDLEQDQVLLAGKEYPEVREELEKRNLFASSFVTREMHSEDLELATLSNGFIYMQGFGDPSTYSKEYPTLKDCVTKVRSLIGDERKIYVGIGVHTPELLQEVYESGADGSFLGSIVIKKEADKDEQAEYLQKLRNIADGAPT